MPPAAAGPSMSTIDLPSASWPVTTRRVCVGIGSSLSMSYMPTDVRITRTKAKPADYIVHSQVVVAHSSKTQPIWRYVFVVEIVDRRPSVWPFQANAEGQGEKTGSLDEGDPNG